MTAAFVRVLASNRQLYVGPAARRTVRIEVFLASDSDATIVAHSDDIETFV